MRVRVGGPRAREYLVDISDVLLREVPPGVPLEEVLLVVGPSRDDIPDSRPRVLLRFQPGDVVQGRKLIAALEALYGRAP